MQTRKICFIDETGNKPLDAESSGASSYFVLAATLVDEADVEPVKAQAERIRADFFQAGVMKSSEVGSDSELRRKILTQIAALPIHVVILAIQKDLISKDSGLDWHKSFFKHASHVLSSKLLFAYPSIEIWQDAHGTKDFMDEFRRYLVRQFDEKQGLPSLFEQPGDPALKLDFDKFADNVMLQVSDMISGSYWRILEGREEDRFEDAFHRILEKRIHFIDQWPPDYRRKRYSKQEVPRDPSLDESLEYYCVKKAHEYLSQAPSESDPEGDAVRKAFVRFLLYRLESRPKTEFVKTKVILRFLNSVSAEPIDQEYLNTRVIGRIRDAGVLISSTPKGYKIPTSVQDIYSFISRANSIVPQMVSQVEEANNQLKIVSFGARNLLDLPEFAQLQRMVETVKR